MKNKMFWITCLASLLSCFTGHAQTLLGKSKEQILSFSSQRNGQIRGIDTMGKGSCEIDIAFPKVTTTSGGMYFSTYYLKGNVCVKSEELIAGQKYIDLLCNKFDKDSGYKRVGNEFVWINKKKKQKILVQYHYRNGALTDRASLISMRLNAGVTDDSL
ncbi:hypothetical protein D0C36_15650 [Mucilaginibacter conchicola]|uniref:Uncharacterized protein n=1 Tax=Mucilaginibacter conchicola TaxID=2303333 RepID=A0A372NUA4_9SPHI|nr:hypothetical protein [Mucilaginibacter conchicola]RFZ92828.1 hypothetical protein D0C36_15650 [Mucilaginibacter conchicola]